MPRHLLPLLLAVGALPSLTSCHISSRGVDFSPVTDRFEPALEDEVVVESNTSGGSVRIATPPSVTTDTPAAPIPAPAPAATPAAPPAAGSTYMVRSGDTLSAIAHRYHMPYARLAEANGIPTTATLQIGQTLRIPAAGSSPVAAAPAAHKAAKPAAKGKAGSYTVKQGDTVYAIARKHGVSPAALMQANKMTPATADKLSLGTTLTIPAK